MSALPGEMTTVELLRRAASALESAYEYRVEPVHRPVAAELRRRADRLMMYVRMTATPGAQPVACAAVLALNAGRAVTLTEEKPEPRDPTPASGFPAGLQERKAT